MHFMLIMYILIAKEENRGIHLAGCMPAVHVATCMPAARSELHHVASCMPKATGHLATPIIRHGSIIRHRHPTWDASSDMGWQDIAELKNLLASMQVQLEDDNSAHQEPHLIESIAHAGHESGMCNRMNSVGAVTILFWLETKHPQPHLFDKLVQACQHVSQYVAMSV